MRNRISNHLLSNRTLSNVQLQQRPTLKLGENQSLTVDMERFFDFSFSFAEALVDLEDRFQPEDSIANPDLNLREQAIRENSNCEIGLGNDFEIDARWM